eukprot:TRINITY_DN1846_c0_g1_i1.p1 TRINITY_DN1846_c0_g1~~TRINITY_DN1846_c0_g1_i1.p1  ORF type:complete len:258 (-),score=37.00 TRINITY_DN1846_c0_g1_i1:11-784(-)
MRSSLLDQTAFILNFHQHWYTIRRIDNIWINFDSLQKRPSIISPMYLEVLLFSLLQEGWSIFVVMGDIPINPCFDSTNWVNIEDSKPSVQDQQERELQEAINLSLQAQLQNKTNPLNPLSPPHHVPISTTEDNREDEDNLEMAIALSLRNGNEQTSQLQVTRDANSSVSVNENDSVDNVNLCIRRPDGQRIEKRFKETSTLKDVVDFLHHSFTDLDISRFIITKSYPRFPLTDLSKTLQEYQLCPSAVLMLEKRRDL